MLEISVVCFLFLGILSALTKVCTEIGSLQLRADIELSLKERLSAALISMFWPEYIGLKMGDISKAISHEGYMIGLGAEAIIQLCGQVLVCCCLIVLAFGLSPKMTVMTLTFGFVSFLISRRISSNVRKYSAAYAASSTSLANAADQYFSNMKFIKSFGLGPYVSHALSCEQKQNAHDFFRTHRLNPLGRGTFEALGIVFIGFVVAFAFWVSPGIFGRLIVFLAVFYRLAPRLMIIQISYNQALSIEPWYSSWRRRHEFALKHQEPLAGDRTTVLKSFQTLRFENVYFSYDARPILKHISFELPFGKTLALVGESGGGKTTVLDLITGLLTPKEGVCRLNDISLQEIALNSWRSKIGLVMQNTPIFHATVLQNIAVADPRPDPVKAERCARMTHAWEFIERLPRKLEFNLGEKGANLSQGECQRLALARALYRDPWLLILDEATSALDAQSEAYILETLKAIKGSLAVLMVSHRFNTVDFADEILLLADGEITERGPYEELLSRSSGDFRRLAKLQGIVS